MSLTFYPSLLSFESKQACSHLKESTAQSQQTVLNLDRDASQINPVLFREYLEAEDDEKGMIEVSRVSLAFFLSLSLFSSALKDGS